jgi:hypothetical protein
MYGNFSMDWPFKQRQPMNETSPSRPINGNWAFHLEQCSGHAK